MSTSSCPQCGAAFECCPRPDQRCWCLDLPPLPAELLGKEAAGCYCPRCLQDKLSSCLSSTGDLSSSFSFSERAGVRASHATAAGPHPNPLAEGAGEQPAAALSKEDKARGRARP